MHWREVAQWLARLFVDAMSATIIGSHPSTGRQMKPWITEYYWIANRRSTKKPEQDGQHRIYLVQLDERKRTLLYGRRKPLPGLQGSYSKEASLLGVTEIVLAAVPSS